MRLSLYLDLIKDHYNLSPQWRPDCDRVRRMGMGDRKGSREKERQDKRKKTERLIVGSVQEEFENLNVSQLWKTTTPYCSITTPFFPQLSNWEM